MTGRALTDRTQHCERFGCEFFTSYGEPMERCKRCGASKEDALRASSNRVPITREDEQRALDKWMAEERAKGWRFKPERSAEEESALADKLHHAIPNSAAEQEADETVDRTVRAWAKGEMSAEDAFAEQQEAIRRATPNRVEEVARLQRVIQSHTYGPDSPTAAFGLANAVWEEMFGA